MRYNYLIFLIFFVFLIQCNQSTLNNSKKINFDIGNRYKNSGFALIYDEKIKGIKKLEERSLNIYHKSLKKKSIVKITNPLNNKYLIAEVKSNSMKFSNFYNAVLSQRIAKELELDFKEPFIELVLVPKNSTFIAKKAKMFEEEKTVAEKAPVDGIQINDLNIKISKKKLLKKKFFLIQ